MIFRLLSSFLLVTSECLKVHFVALGLKYQSCGPCGFREEDFLIFPHSKSMETMDPRGVAKFDPRGMNGTIYVEDH